MRRRLRRWCSPHLQMWAIFRPNAGKSPPLPARAPFDKLRASGTQKARKRRATRFLVKLLPGQSEKQGLQQPLVTSRKLKKPLLFVISGSAKRENNLCRRNGPVGASAAGGLRPTCGRPTARTSAAKRGANARPFLFRAAGLCLAFQQNQQFRPGQHPNRSKPARNRRGPLGPTRRARSRASTIPTPRSSGWVFR